MKKRDQNLIQKIIDILGKERVSENEDLLKEYSGDMTENEPHLPDLVCYPLKAEEISSILKLANEFKVPVIPRVFNTNLGGLTIPEQGGIVLDLRRMNKILEVNEVDKYMVIEPGVTQEDIFNKLEKEYPDLRFGYSLAPPDVSVLANGLMDGLVNLSNRFGTMSSWLNGLEVILPNGEIVTTGSKAVVNKWFGEAPLPHLTDLFINSFGGTGIATKAAVALWSKPPFEEKYFVFTYDIPATFEFFKKISDSGIADDIGIISWPMGKILFGNEKPLFRDQSEPLFFVYIHLTGATRKILTEQGKYIEKTVALLKKEKNYRIDEPIKVSDILKIEPALGKFAVFPTRLDFLVDYKGKGLTWLGTYGPVSGFCDGAKEIFDISEKYETPPMIVCRIMWGGHFMVLRMISCFNHEDKAETEKIRALNWELYHKLIDLSFVPYKTPSWASKLLSDRLSPTFKNLAGDIKNVLDPNKIMNPGKGLFS